MIGMIVVGDSPVVRLRDDGTWEDVEDPRDGGVPPNLGPYLNGRFHPERNAEPLDHHLPYGHAALGRAAEALGGDVLLPPKEQAKQPLPPGVTP